MPLKKRKLSVDESLEGASVESNTDKKQRYSASVLFKPNISAKTDEKSSGDDVIKKPLDPSASANDVQPKEDILFVPKLSIKRRVDNKFAVQHKQPVLVYNRLNESSSNISASSSSDSSSSGSESGSSSSSSDNEEGEEGQNEDDQDELSTESGSEDDDEDVSDDDETEDVDEDEGEIDENVKGRKVGNHYVQDTPVPIKMKLKVPIPKVDDGNTPLKSLNQSQSVSKKVKFDEDSENFKGKRGRKLGYRKIMLDSEGNEIPPKEKSTPKARSITSYFLYCQATTPKVAEKNPHLRIREQRKIVSEMWNKLTDKERLVWRQKALKLQKKGSKGMISTGVTVEGQQQYIVKKQITTPNESLNTSAVTKTIVGNNVPTLPENLAHFAEDFKPSDLAAYLALLGESITTIGNRLREHEGKFAVQGASVVLMDSFLCSLGPIFCLTSQIEEMNGCPRDMLMRILDNISYIMPGI